MADISMCGRNRCSMAKTCYRKTAKANPYRQTYMHPPTTGKECEYYWLDVTKVLNEKKKIR